MMGKINSVFNQDGSLTNDALRACTAMKIDPELLKVVTQKELEDQGLAPSIAKVRTEHILEKRQKRIDMIENTIKSGILGQLS